MLRKLKNIFKNRVVQVMYGHWQFAFEIEGVKFYYLPNQSKMLIPRLGAIEETLQEIGMGLSKSELTDIRNVMKSALEKKEYATIGWAITEMEHREEFLVHPDLLMKLAALVFIREDENPAYVSTEIVADNIRLFHKAIALNQDAASFFFHPALLGYLNFIKDLNPDFNDLFREGKIKVQGLRHFLRVYLLKKISSPQGKQESVNTV